MPTHCEICETPAATRLYAQGRYICSKCFLGLYFYCEECGGVGLINDSYICNNKQLCYDCWRKYSQWESTKVPQSLTAKKLGSTRCFGVELETAQCNGYLKLRNKTVFGVKEDGSIDGMEFVSPILSGDDGIREVRKFCRLAKNFTVDYQCGFHVHIDLRDTTAEQRKLLAYAYRLTFWLWGALVEKERLGNEFCQSPPYTPEDVLTGNYGHSRYEFINWRAYGTHKTVEIRGFEGTLNAKEICNWVAAHLRFVDAVLNMGLEEINSKFKNKKSHRNLRRIIGKRLSDFYAKNWKEAKLVGILCV